MKEESAKRKVFKMPEPKVWKPKYKNRINDWNRWAANLSTSLDRPMEQLNCEDEAFQVYIDKKPFIKPDKKDCKWIKQPPPCGFGNGYPIRKDGTVVSQIEQEFLPEDLPRIPWYRQPMHSCDPMWPKESDDSPKRNEDGGNLHPRQVFGSGMLERPDDRKVLFDVYESGSRSRPRG